MGKYLAYSAARFWYKKLLPPKNFDFLTVYFNLLKITLPYLRFWVQFKKGV